jgi:hypothetical protein
VAADAGDKEKGISQPYKPEAARENAAQLTNLSTLKFHSYEN